MSEGTRDVFILDPTVQSAEGAARRRAPRPAKLDGIDLGLLANGKTNAMALLDRVAQNLSRRYAIGRILRAEKPSAGAPIPDSLLETMADRCGAVITAIGD